MNKNDPIKVLAELYERHMPETVYLVRNKARYDKIISAMEKIQEFISSIEEDAKFEILKDELIGTSLSLEVNCTLLSMTEVDEFCNAVKVADSIDIVPLVDGTLRVVFGFEDAYVPYEPKK